MVFVAAVFERHHIGTVDRLRLATNGTNAMPFQ
jgi:hypothetical protein